MQSIDTRKWLEYVLHIVVGKMLYQTKAYKIFEMVQKSSNKFVLKKAPEYDY